MNNFNMNNIIFAQNLQRLMNKSKIDRSKLCDDLGFKYSTVSEWLSAKKYPRMEKIEKLAEYFEVQKAELIEKQFSQIPNSQVPIPLIGRCAAGLSCYAEDNITTYIQTDKDILQAGYDHFWLAVKGDSMEPELHENDYVLVRKQSTLLKPCLAVVRVDDEDGVVKEVIISKDSITLNSLNRYYPPRVFEKEEMNRIHLVGKVIEIKRRLE